MASEILFITTTDAAGGRVSDLARLLTSIEASLVGRDWRMLLLVQRASPGMELGVAIPANVAVEAIPDRISLSRARNLLLGKAREQGLLSRTVLVAFPDDDCWYPEGALERILNLFRIDQGLDFWFCAYASAPSTPLRALSMDTKPPSVFNVAAKASSNTIFLRNHIVERIGGFDEELGVGTANNGGEDTDYALRAFSEARKSRFVDQRLIGHRDHDARFRSHYFRGSLIAIARHTAKRPASVALLLRKLIVGSVLVATRRMPAKDFMTALKAAFSPSPGRRSKREAA
ncbi:glycosyltransferase family 2 protein [Taklimakanibacter deserti]|uniref:glycosyltransferase family 2 protein n=1 Tax=Taklimakanibacter deserti TaxID=2267839 RepID=UPI000E65C3EA